MKKRSRKILYLGMQNQIAFICQSRYCFYPLAGWFLRM